MAKVSCRQCDGVMRKTTKVDSSCAMQLVGLILFCTGFFLLFVIPVGTVIGIILMLVSLGMGYKRQKVWKCKSCGYFFERD